MALTSFFLPLLFLLHHSIVSSASFWEAKSNRWDDLPNALGATTFDPSKVKQVSWKPRAFLYKSFLSHRECDHLISLAKKNLQHSMVADNESGKSLKSTVRTSSGYFLRKHHDEVVSRIERRIAAWTFLPEENGESIHVLRYKLGQKYDAHYDYFSDPNNIKRGGHRYATVLMYLADVERGGETVFPNALLGHQYKDETWSDCSRQGFAVKPRKGDAVLFFNLYPNTTTDTHSLHASCPVMEGEKWSATKWIHVRSYDRLLTPSETDEVKPPAGGCVDEDANCEYWASRGECQTNALYMLDHCRKSCKACTRTTTSS